MLEPPDPQTRREIDDLHVRRRSLRHELGGSHDHVKKPSGKGGTDDRAEIRARRCACLNVQRRKRPAAIPISPARSSQPGPRRRYSRAHCVTRSHRDHRRRAEQSPLGSSGRAKSNVTTEQERPREIASPPVTGASKQPRLTSTPHSQPTAQHLRPFRILNLDLLRKREDRLRSQRPRDRAAHGGPQLRSAQAVPNRLAFSPHETRQARRSAAHREQCIENDGSL
jgi:hypothetical protein